MSDYDSINSPENSHQEILSISSVFSGDRQYFEHPMLNLNCPVCQFEYVHFGLPYIIPGKDGYQAWSGRGDLLVIPMWAECGSEFEIHIGFHKGNSATFVKLQLSCEEPQKYIYFIEAIGLHRIKIGVSGSPEKRLKQLQTASPFTLKLIAKFPGGYSTEKLLHRQFEYLRIDNEWFHAGKSLIEFIDKVDSEVPEYPREPSQTMKNDPYS